MYSQLVLSELGVAFWSSALVSHSEEAVSVLSVDCGVGVPPPTQEVSCVIVCV